MRSVFQIILEFDSEAEALTEKIYGSKFCREQFTTGV
jgi:hypothetical protein